MARTEIYFATRKAAKAHVLITKGVGKIRINNVPIEIFEPKVAQEVILTPIEISEDLRNKVDISVRVNGGGFMGQAYAAATGITRALIGWTKSKKDVKEHPFTKTQRNDLKAKIDEFDRYLIKGDARRRKQKSYR